VKMTGARSCCVKGLPPSRRTLNFCLDGVGGGGGICVSEGELIDTIEDCP
jgi:hypothetical protein